MSKLDKIFSDRLANHPVTPSSAAWGKLNSGLSKQNSALPLLRWAAVLVPILFLIGLGLLNKPVPSPTLVKNSLPIPPASSGNMVPPVKQPEPIASAVQKVKRNRPILIKEEKMPPVDEQQNEPVTMVETTTPEAIAMTTPSIEPVVEIPAIIPQQTKPIVLEYTLATITSNNLDEENRKSSSIQKVVEFTQTVKHSDPLSELRVMKEELLAIDFRKKSGKKN